MGSSRNAKSDCREGVGEVERGLGAIRVIHNAQFEISIDGVPRTYRDRKDLALLAAQILKSRNPNSVVKLKDLQTGEEIIIAFKAATIATCHSVDPALPASAPGSTRTARITPSKAQFQKSWDAWKGWAKLEAAPCCSSRIIDPLYICQTLFAHQ